MNSDSLIERREIETVAGTYVLETHYDFDGGSGNPLIEYDHPGVTFAVLGNGYGGRMHEVVNTLASAAGNAVQTWLDDGYDNEDIERRFALWRNITGDQTILYTSIDDASQSDWYRSLVLVEFDSDHPEWDRQSCAEATISEFITWARGEVFGYNVESPDGEFIGGSWGYIGEEHFAQVLQEELEAEIQFDVDKRLDAVNLVGAGFVGLL